MTKVTYIQSEKEGNTIFHILASYTNLSEKEIKILELLMNLEGFMQGEMEAKNKEGKTPLDVAEESGNQKFINITRIKLNKLPEWKRPDENALQPLTSTPLGSVNKILK